MTIRKITGATSSVVVSATTTQFGIHKAHVSQPSLINKISNATARLIPKAHLASASLINRLLYDPDGFGTRSFFDFIFIGEKPSFYSNKRLDDSFSFLDSVLLNTVKNREPSDVVNSDEAINFLIRARRTFDDSSEQIDRPYLFLSKGAIEDTLSILDFVSIVRVKNFNETIASNEELTRLITAKRTFDDSVGMVDNFTFIDGSTYSLNRLIGEFITIGSETDIRTSGNAKENISFFIDKVLDPDMELLSRISLINLKGVSDYQDLLDLKALQFRTQFSELFNSNSKTLLDVRKPFLDNIFVGTASPPAGLITSSGATRFSQPATSSTMYLRATVSPVGTSNSATYEWWWNATTSTGNRRIFSSRDFNVSQSGLEVNLSNNNLRLEGPSGVVSDSSTTSITTNVWNHYALVRNGSTTWILYLNGLSKLTINLTNCTSTSIYLGRRGIGFGGANTQHADGYMADFRYVLGAAVYTANFTRPTTSLTSISGPGYSTDLLLNMSTEATWLTDSSPNNRTITAVLNPTFAAQGPFSTGSEGSNRYSGDPLENFSYFFDKVQVDTTPMLDNFDLGDEFLFDYVKRFSELIPALDLPQLLLDKVVFDSQTFTDFAQSFVRKQNQSNATPVEDLSTFFGKVNNDTLSFLENILIVRGRQFLDTILPTESNVFLVSKLLQDSVIADDPLIRLTDGINYYNLLSRYETQPAIDRFTRIVEFYRYPHHGFLSPVTPQERNFKFVSLIAKAGAFSQVPILRTNRIAWSEQLEQGYWEKTGLSLTTNAIAPPSNVSVSTDPTYDANQLQESFYNQPLNPYGRNWFQLVPFLEDFTSDADLIVAQSSDSQHSFNSPSILEFFDGQTFAFSVYAKYAGVKYIKLIAGQSTTFAIFNIQNGSVVERSANDVKASIRPVGDGFFLCEFSHTISTYGASPELQEAQRFFWNQSSGLYSSYEYILVPASVATSVKINLLNDSLEESYLGDGVSGAYLWGIQLETGEQVEQEVSSLNYIRTAGGPRSRLNYRIMPNDSDRVYVGTLLRDGTTLRVSGDQYENFSFILQQRIFPDNERAFPTDYFARSVNQSIGPNLSLYSSLAVSVRAGSPAQGRVAGSAEEIIAFWFNKDVKKGGTSTAFSYKTIRQNLIRWSERFDYDYWTKINTTATTGISLMAGALPYRNVSLDANQVYGIFHDKEYTYQKYRWWDAVPLKNKPNFTSNAVVDLYESDVAGPHQLQTFGFATNLSGDFFASSIYASNANGVNRFRLQVGTVYADFNLSSQTVITSSGTLYTNISLIDAASKWYLCQIVGPTVALGLFNFSDSVATTELIQLLQPLFVGNELLTVNDITIPYFIKAREDTQPIADLKLGNFIKKEFSETRSIERNRIADALRVAGVQLYKTTSSSVDLTKYTPLSTEDSIYYRANEWWSELPNYTRARFAIGNAGTGPNMIDNMSLGDDFTYSGQITLNSDDNFVTLTSRPVAILNKQPSFVDNLVTIGGTSGFRRQPTESSSETTRFDFKLNFYENRSIPTIPQFDAEMITGLFYNTRQDIDGTQYTPVNGSYVYRKKTDWYNLVTRFARPRIAFGPGDRRGPVTFDNFQIADGFTYDGTIVLNSDDNFTSPVENISKNFILAAKHGVYSDFYYGYRADTTEDALRLMEISAKPNKEWYQLANYYDDYNHLKAAPEDRDFVRVGSQGGALRHQSWGLENILYFFDKGLSDTTIMIDNMELGDDLTYDQQKLLQDLVIAGSQYGERNLDTSEKVSFINQLRAKRGGERSILTFDISNNTEADAELTAETQSIYPDDWYKLAPYYDTYVNLIDEPTDALDRVRVGSQTSGKRTNADPFEKVSFFLLPKPLSSTQTVESRKGNHTIKELSETRMIPQNPRFDASRVMGLDLVNKTTSVINLTQYTPISGSTTYYAANDWYSEVPKFNRARFAIGNAGIGPQMVDSFSFGDNLTYDGNKFLSSISITVGTQLTSVSLVYTNTWVSSVVTSLTQNLISYSEDLLANTWTTSLMSVGLPVPPPFGAPDGGSSNTLTSTAPFGIGKISTPLGRLITSGTFITVSAYVKWNTITSGNLLRFGLAINSSNVTHGVQFNVLNAVTPTTSVVTYFISQFTPVVGLSSSAGSWYRIQFAVQAPRLLTSGPPGNTKIVFEHYSGSSIIFSAWGVQVAEAPVAPTYRATTSETLEASIVYSNTLITSSTNVGTKYSNDSIENTSFFVNKTAKLGVFKDLYIKRDRGLGDYASETTHAENWFQLAPYYDDYDHILNTPEDRDLVTVGNPRLGKKHVSWPLEIIELNLNKGLSSNHIVVGTSYGGRNQTGMDTSELVKFTTLLNPKRTGTSEATKYGNIRTNFLTYSEDFVNSYWTKVNTTITIPTILMPVSYPYRNTLIDANQVIEAFETDNPYTLNNYYKKWYQSVPLTNRAAVTSNVLNVLSDTTSNTEHYLEAILTEFIQSPYNYYSFNLYVQNANLARYFRLSVNNNWVDFDLNLASVTSSLGVLYSTIKTIDTSNNIRLCQFIGVSTTSISVKVQLKNSSQALTYAGNSSNSIYIWGAQLELGEYYEDLRNDLDNYRYIRSRGVQSQAISFRFGLDQTPEFVLPEERVFQSVRLTARSAGTFFNTQIERLDNTSGSAARTQELFIPETWYQLAPHFASYINLFNNPNERGDTITVGELDETVLDVIEDYNIISGTVDFGSLSGSEDYRYLPA